MNTNSFSFYSYKGGSGRTTTLINTVFHLADILEADAEHPVLLVDADVESAGLTYFFDCANKFTDCFDQTIHTGKFFDESSDLLSSNSSIKKMIFGKSGKVFVSDQSDLKREWEQVYPNQSFEETFGETQLTFSQIQILMIILKNCHSGSQNERDLLIRSLWSDRLNEYRQRLRDARTAAEKETVLHAFLPASQFVDVSRFFSKEDGTVMFLGVDIHYLGKRIQITESAAQNRGDTIQRGQQFSHGSFNLAQKLVSVCQSFHYKAIVFDCGAGTQTTAELIHAVSDVIVYCMRPTLQFIRGTNTQLTEKFMMLKNKVTSQKSDKYKPVILLPTSIPPVMKTSANGVDVLKEDSFRLIKSLIEGKKQVIDCSFCTPDKALVEVEYFKWREGILGSSYTGKNKPEVDAIVKKYSCVDTMPEDARQAFETYKALAGALKENVDAKHAGEDDADWEE